MTLHEPNHQSTYDMLNSICTTDMPNKDVTSIVYRLIMGGCIPPHDLRDLIYNDQRI